MAESYVIRKGDWFTSAHSQNPSDEEVFEFAQNLVNSCPAVIQKRQWGYVEGKGQVIESYEVIKDFNGYDPDDAIYTRFCIASIAAWLPITLP